MRTPNDWVLICDITVFEMNIQKIIKPLILFFVFFAILFLLMLFFEKEVPQSFLIAYYSFWILISVGGIFISSKNLLHTKDWRTKLTSASRTLIFWQSVASISLGIGILISQKLSLNFLEGIAWFGNGISLLLISVNEAHISPTPISPDQLVVKIQRNSRNNFPSYEVVTILNIPESDDKIVLFDFTHPFANVLRCNSTGSILWQAELPTENDVYSNIEWKNQSLCAFSRSCIYVALDVDTGKIIRS